jgi:hypothetical protein
MMVDAVLTEAKLNKGSKWSIKLFNIYALK